MEKIDLKERPMFGAERSEIVQLYNLVYLFLMDFKKKGRKITKRYKAAVREPGWAASEILYLALYGYTKRTKFAKRGQYIRWSRPPKSLRARVLFLIGKEGKEFASSLENTVPVESVIPEESGDDKAPYDSPLVSGMFNTDSIEEQRRMQKYIEDFDLHSEVDLDLLRNFVRTQLLIEQAHKRMLMGKSTQLDIKSLADQLKNYTTLLGLSKKDRIDLGAERKKGSIAELAGVYEETLQEYPELESEFLIEELEMLLDKHERLDSDGNREISAMEFRVISGGYTLEEARELTGRKRTNAKRAKNRPLN